MTHIDNFVLNAFNNSNTINGPSSPTAPQSTFQQHSLPPPPARKQPRAIGPLLPFLGFREGISFLASSFVMIQIGLCK
jgi:hypothetical protein